MSLRIGYDFTAWDAATITSNTEASADLADDNAIDPQPSKIYRTSGDTGEWIKFDLGAAVNLTQFFIANHNLTSAATLTHEAHTSDSWGTPDHTQALTITTDADSDVIPFINYFPSGGVNKRWHRFTVEDGANPDTYIEFGVIKGCAYYQPPRNIRDGYSWQRVDRSIKQDVEGTYTEAIDKGTSRKLSIGIPFSEQTQNDKFDAIFRKVKNVNPLVVSVGSANRVEDTIYCRLLTPLRMVHTITTTFDIGVLTFGELVD